jgi:TonB family protein
MRFWLHSTAKTTSLGPSVLSFVAHVALVGLAVRGTAISARELVESLSQRITYLPPPDRRGGRENTVERLEYVEIGGGANVPLEGKGGLLPQGGPRPEPHFGGDVGNAIHPKEKSTADASEDSVYSVLEVEERAVRTTNSAAPVYPADLMKEGTEGGVLIRFVVDTTGHADPSSVEVVRSTHPAFTASVRAAIPQMSFTPAMVGGRHVRQAVEQNFEFRITTPPPAVAEQTRTKRAP